MLLHGTCVCARQLPVNLMEPFVTYIYIFRGWQLNSLSLFCVCLCDVVVDGAANNLEMAHSPSLSAHYIAISIGINVRRYLPTELTCDEEKNAMKQTDADTTITKNTHRMDIRADRRYKKHELARIERKECRQSHVASCFFSLWFSRPAEVCCYEHMILITKMNIRKTVVVDGVPDFFPFGRLMKHLELGLGEVEG